jgi:hypothetical protein
MDSWPVIRWKHWPTCVESALYDKNEMSDLSKKDRETLEGLLKIELKIRKKV